MPCFLARRISICWSPDKASEPTDTVVLTGSQTGCFLDTRFIKGSNHLDWAFAGYKLSSGSTSFKFVHHIDSRTLMPLDVNDHGTNTELPNGDTLETGTMVNPVTGKMTEFEEIWKDEEVQDGIFIRNTKGTQWQARVGNVQLGLGRDVNGLFWAWQAEREQLGEPWKVNHWMDTVVARYFLPEGSDLADWREGAEVEWADDSWIVLESSVATND